MGKRIVVMFTMLLASLAILLTSDLIVTQMIYSRLDNVSTTVGYYISKDGGITEAVKEYVRKEMDATIYSANEEEAPVKKGDTYFYIVEKKYTPIIFHIGEDIVQVKRSVVIGLYNNI